MITVEELHSVVLYMKTTVCNSISLRDRPYTKLSNTNTLNEHSTQMFNLLDPGRLLQTGFKLIKIWKNTETNSLNSAHKGWASILQTQAFSIPQPERSPHFTYLRKNT